MLCIANGQWNVLAHGEAGCIKVARPHKDAHHVVDAVLVCRVLPLVLAGMLNAVLFELAVAIGIAVPYFVNIVAIALACALAEIQGRE